MGSIAADAVANERNGLKRPALPSGNASGQWSSLRMYASLSALSGARRGIFNQEEV
jgi:hypothetical protein